VPKRRKPEAGIVLRAVGVAGTFVLWTLARAARRPVDAVACVVAGLSSIAILVNALFLQTGSHPAPFFAAPAPPATTAAARPKAGDGPIAKATEPPVPAAAPTVPVHATGSTRPSQPAAVRHNDPIADLIGPSSRIMAVQRVLSEFGYGQVKPTGFLDDATSTAIQKFEREHKLPVTGRVTDRLVSDLAQMTGHPLN
jgi:peptidoglycan hydrolase-like protein with peptidoglycan-binding domain